MQSVDVMNDIAHPDLTVNRKVYRWNANQQGYFGHETTCGVYGTLLIDNQWLPVCINDNGFVDTANQTYDTPERAIEESHNYFT